MCSRFSLTSPVEAVRAHFKTERDFPYPPRYNIAPTQPVAIVRAGADRKRELVLVRWGLIPGWVKDPDSFAVVLNARAETAMEKPSFANALKHRRCIIPADAFYEWKGPPRARTPFMISSASGPTLMGLAGLWEHWMGKDGTEIETMAILTVPANRAIARLHDRMPAVLPAEATDAWLDVGSVRDRVAVEFLRPAPDALLTSAPLLPAINNPRLEGAYLQSWATLL